MLELSAIAVFPVKSMRGVDLSRGEVEPRGLAGDRRFMVVDAARRFVTARECPGLLRVSPAFEGDALVLSAPGRSSLRVLPAGANASGPAVEIWGDRCAAVDAGDAAAEWLSTVLGVAARLVQMTDACERGIDPDFSEPGDRVSFADAFPLLLIGEASLADLNARLPAPVEMRRFRPNVVVRGSPAYAEDDWSRLRIGPVEFAGARACRRCALPTLDPQSGEAHPRREPMRTLSRYRRRADGVYFGQLLIPRTTGSIGVGDAVEIIE